MVLNISHQYVSQLNKLWEFPIDNVFAKGLFRDSGELEATTSTAKAAKLCDTCTRMDFWQPLFRIDDKLLDLEVKSKICDFCRMRLKIARHHKITGAIIFDRVESMLRINERYPPVMSICRNFEPTESIISTIQIGLSKLPLAESSQHYKTLRHWLSYCDKSHAKCLRSGLSTLPTRLVDVGDNISATIRLYETQKDDKLTYLALSHPWGKPPHFCTFRDNIDEYKQSIDFSLLPATFQHAVTITRQLGHRYLWIDSICIIQGPDGDFGEESKKMENVFSSAYCVLAASAATGQKDGFLKIRDERKCITFDRDGLPPFYVCEFIDNFAQHVLEGFLNTRGWVLQERALARRTIYFTKKQTYWECGEGVRCETLTKMHNKLASFIGDSNFPEVAMKSNKGMKIRLYQDLYIQYSRLLFSFIGDRPFGIAGLEKRLKDALNTKGGFGIFDDGRSLLQRSLLWQRGFDETSLEKIVFPTDRQSLVPSWSWMAYNGGINYLDLPFDGVDWEERDIHSPWTTDMRSLVSTQPSAIAHTGDQTGRGYTEIIATARAFSFAGKIKDDGSQLFYDISTATASSDHSPITMCVIVGRLKEPRHDEQKKMHFILLVAPKGPQTARAGPICERVGVGRVLGRWIKLDGQGRSIKIR